MIQGGDPTGNPPGTGGPGYTIDEEVPNEGEYQIGSLAMAKRTAPGTTGAQFFIVTGAAGEALPPQYSLFGQVTEGLDVVESIEALPTDETDFPTEDIIVNSITITEA
jgi:cyclophilin family peptidyl-prolyl cis-trans isomerase